MMTAVFNNELWLSIKEKLRCKGVDVATLAAPRACGALQSSLDTFFHQQAAS